MDDTAPQTPGFPAAIADLYKPLWNQAAWLFAKWDTYVRLFGTSEADLTVINTAAGSFFALFQNICIGDLLLNISRLTDRKGTGQRMNLSLKTLVHSVDATTAAELRAEAERRLTIASDLAGFAREWRNRQVAHLDLRTSLGTHADPLSPYTRGDVQKSLDSIADVLNAFSQHFGGGTTFFDGFIHGPGDAGVLVARLRDGLTLREWRLSEKRQGRSGALSPEV